jgi:hypothetical protein
MRVEVYWNFHRKCYSVRALEGPDKGRVVQHRRDLQIAGAKLVVRKAGREKVLRERRKNVHAFVRGHLVEGASLSMNGASVGVGYNPYQMDSFTAFSSDPFVLPVPIREARLIHLFTSGPENRSNMRALI